LERIDDDMKEDLPTVIDSDDLQNQVDQFSERLSSYLCYLGLPAENVLVELSERRLIINIMPNIIRRLTDDQKIKSYYISKFIASCLSGLFDAALNYLWDETISNLRSKVAHFDLNYFYDSTITDGARREKFISEEDLKNLDDWELIRGCTETGIISEIGYIHLDFIRQMRNFASAAHPNQTQLTGLQLANWLDTCIREVLAKDPSGPVLEIKRLLTNIRKERLDDKSAAPIIASIKKLPKDLLHSLLRALFGMYTDIKLPQNVRDNIDKISIDVWTLADESAKQNISKKYAIYSANAEQQRKSLAREFLNKVDGLSYLAEDQLAGELSEALENLSKAHYDFQNFYKEEPHAKMLTKLIPKTGIIPEIVRYDYVKTLTICRLGNRYGVSYGALPYYDLLIGAFRDDEILDFFELLDDLEIISLLQYKIFLNRFIEISLRLEGQTINEILKHALRKLRDYTDKDITSRRAYREMITLTRS